MAFTDKLIYKLAHYYFRMLPAESTLELEDFIQEGRMVAAEKEPSYDPDVAKFTTYIYHPVRKRFQQMLRQEHLWYAGKICAILNDDGDIEFDLSANLPDCSGDPERLLLVREAIILLSDDYPELADLIVSGIPTDLLVFAKAEMREKAENTEIDLADRPFKISRQLMSDYYGINRKKFAQLRRKYLFPVS